MQISQLSVGDQVTARSIGMALELAEVARACRWPPSEKRREDRGRRPGKRPGGDATGVPSGLGKGHAAAPPSATLDICARPVRRRVHARTKASGTPHNARAHDSSRQETGEGLDLLAPIELAPAPGDLFAKRGLTGLAVKTADGFGQLLG